MSKSKYACVSVKAMAMKTKRITVLQYRELIGAKDVQTVLQFLKNHTCYSEFLQKLDPENCHRAEIEVRLNDLKVRETEKLMHYLDGADKAFFKMFLIWQEVEALRILIRGLSRGDDLGALRNLVVYSEKHSKVPFGRLFRAKDWETFKKLLADSDYYRVLEIYKDVTDLQDLVMVEKSLDRYYYDLLKNRLLMLDKKTNRDLIEVQQRNFDLLNLVWIYRGKKFYHLSREELIAYSLRGGYEITEKRLADLAGAKNLAEMKTQLTNSEYAFLFNHTETIDLYMERRRERYLYYRYRQLFRAGSESLGRAVAHIYLLDFEIHDITAIIESKRYRLGPEETRKYLIRAVD